MGVFFYLFKGIRHVEGEMSAKPPQGLLPRYGHSLLDEARAEIRNLWVLHQMDVPQTHKQKPSWNGWHYICSHVLPVLSNAREDMIESQQAQMEEMERSAEMLRDQLKRKEREFEQSLLQTREHQASGQRCCSLVLNTALVNSFNCCNRLLIWLQQSLNSCSDELCVFCRLTIKDNVEMIKLQKLLSEKANTFTVLEGRFLQQHEVRLTARDSSGKKIIV